MRSCRAGLTFATAGSRQRRRHCRGACCLLERASPSRPREASVVPRPTKRMNEVAELIEKLVLQQRLMERTVVVHGEVLARLLCQLRRLSDDLAPDDRRARSIGGGPMMDFQSWPRVIEV